MQEIINQFLRTYQARLKPSTLRDYQSILGHHLSRFKDFEDLNRSLEEYLAGLLITGKRKNNILSARQDLHQLGQAAGNLGRKVLQNSPVPLS